MKRTQNQIRFTTVNWRMFILAGCLASCMGCHAANHFHARSLPPEYLIRPSENAQTVDLSKLAVKGVNNEYIDNGDVLEVTIAAGLNRDDTSTQQARVSDEGLLRLPVIGDIPVAGLDLEGAEQAIMTSCVQRQLFRAPNVTVTMKRQRTNKVTVMGAVKEPGIIELPRGNCDLLTAIVKAGGLSKEAGTNVEIRQPGTIRQKSEVDALSKNTLGHKTQSVGYAPPNKNGEVSPRNGEVTAPENQGEPPGSTLRVNLVAAAKSGNGGGFIEDGAVIMVEKRDPTPLQIIGLVRKPDRYDFPVGQDITVLGAIALAGGTSSKVADKVIITRPVPNQPDPVVIQVSISEAKRKGGANLLLAPGDVLSVEPTASTILLDAVEIVRFGIGATLF